MKLPLPTWFVDRLIARAHRTPYIHLDGYLHRWWLVPYNRFGYAARVHQFLSSDRDRHLHNHPWPYVSVVLRGGYWEETAVEKRHWASGRAAESREQRWYGPGSVLVRGADHFHRVLLDIGPDHREQPCWTLFITGPKRDDAPGGHSCWGFMVDDIFRPADVYLGDAYVRTDYRGRQ